MGINISLKVPIEGQFVAHLFYFFHPFLGLIQGGESISFHIHLQVLGVVDFQFGGGILAFLGAIDLFRRR